MFSNSIRKIEINHYLKTPYESFERGYEAGYKYALECSIRELQELKNIMLNISLIQYKDDDDV